MAVQADDEGRGRSNKGLSVSRCCVRYSWVCRIKERLTCHVGRLHERSDWIDFGRSKGEKEGRS
jgi:hypothetical protein